MKEEQSRRTRLGNSTEEGRDEVDKKDKSEKR